MNIESKELKKTKDYSHVRDLAALIEQNLEAYGHNVHVVEVDITKISYEFFLEVAIGTNLTKLEKLDRERALALSSPTGKVYWRFPIPGKCYVGLILPRTSKDLEHHELMHLYRGDWRSKLAEAFYSLGDANYSLARKILGIA